MDPRDTSSLQCSHTHTHSHTQREFIAVELTSVAPASEVKAVVRSPINMATGFDFNKTSGSAIAEGPRDVLLSRNSATTKYRYRVALFA